MTTCTDCQSLSNMLRRLFVLLASCGFIAAYSARENISLVAKINTNCSDDGELTGRAMDRIKPMSLDINRSGDLRVGRRLEEGFWKNNVAESQVTSRKKDKDKGYGKMILYFIGAAKATMLYVMLHGIAAVAGKALIAAKVALVIATAIALKKSSEHNEGVSYEIIKHPHHSYIHTHSSSIDYDHHGDHDENGYSHRKRRRIQR